MMLVLTAMIDAGGVFSDDRDIPYQCDGQEKAGKVNSESRPWRSHEGLFAGGDGGQTINVHILLLGTGALGPSLHAWSTGHNCLGGTGRSIVWNGMTAIKTSMIYRGGLPSCWTVPG